MPALTKQRLEEILARRLKLKTPQFKLEKLGSTIIGSVISDSFKRKSDLQRVPLVRHAIEDELGATVARRVGTILPYTSDEWNGPFEADEMRPRKRTRK